MKRVIYIASIVLALGFTSCLNDIIDEGGATAKQVRIWAGISNDTSSRAAEEEGSAFQYTRVEVNSNPGIRLPQYDGTLDIGIERVSKKEDADHYPDFRDLGVPILATLGNTDGSSGNIRPIEFLSQAQFFPDASSELRYAAWYPWKDSDSDPYTDDYGSVYYSNENATHVTVDINGSKDVLYGNVIEGSLNSGFPVMEFDHALCVFRIHVYAMLAYDENGQEIPIVDWGTINEITLKNVPEQVRMVLPHLCNEIVDGQPVHNGESADLFTLEYLGERTLELHNDPNIPFDPPAQLPLGITKSVMVSEVIAGPPASGVLELSIKTSTQQASQEVSIARNFKPGHAYDIVLRFSDHGMINAEAMVGQWGTNPPVEEEAAADMFYDLSANETSNCYIVRSANYSYCFDSDVKGNGDGSLMGMSAADASVDVNWVEVLWSDLPDMDLNDDGTPDEIFTLQSNRPSDDRVLFNIHGYTTGEGESLNTDNKMLPAYGNVVLGGYDKEGGELLWTWHLWLTTQPEPIGCSNGFVVLDRNLGAKTNVPTSGGVEDGAHGLLYQWGRPTPLNADGLTSTTVQIDLAAPFSEGANVLYGQGDANGEWISPSSKWYAEREHMWGDTGNNYENQKKTLYDPCPPGYFVANYAFWRDFEDYEVAYGQDTGGATAAGAIVNRNSENIWLPFTTVYNDSATPDGSYEGISLRTSSVEDATGVPYNFYYTASKTAERTTERSYSNYAMPVRCISTATAPTTINLSESQTANCYVVTEPGYYKFKGNIRGNGVTELWPFGNSTSKYMFDFSDGMEANINPSRVDLLWWQGDFTEMATVSDAEMIQKLQCIEIQNDGKLKDGFVEFNIREGNFHAGNAVIAAYDGSGTILWTWHIWMPASRPADIRSGRRTVQDRHLGATQVPTISQTGTGLQFVDYKGNTSTSNEAVWSTFGFLYQWGRKDPIMGAPIGTTNADAVANLACAPYWTKAYSADGTGAWTKRTTIPRTAGPMDLSAVVKTPLSFVYTTAGAGNNASMWFTHIELASVDSSLWGYAVMGTGVGEDFSKTFYDPCPPGYRTAFHTVWRDASGNGYGGDDSGPETYSWSTERNFTNYGFVTIKENFERTFYPYAGRRSYTGALENASTIGYFTSGMPYGNNNTRTYRYGGYNNNNSQQVVNEGRSYARSVRCMKE